MKNDCRFVEIFYKNLDLMSLIDTSILELDDCSNSNSVQYFDDLEEVFDFLYQFKDLFNFTADLQKVLSNELSINIFSC